MRVLLNVSNKYSLIKDFLVGKFPFLLKLRRKRKVYLDRNLYSAVMLHNIPDNGNYFYFSTLKDWIEIVNVLSKHFKFTFIPKNKNEIAITIDDGFKMIKPFLDFSIERGIPVIVFISPLGFEKKIYPYSVFIQFFRKFEGEIFEYKNYKVKFLSRNILYREREAFKFNRYLLENVSYEEYLALATYILKKYQIYFKKIDEDLQLLTIDDVKHYSKYPNILFQSHGIYHFNMCRMTNEQLDYELEFSKLRIEDVTGLEVKYFAYPYGFYNKRVKNHTQKYYEKAFIVGSDKDHFHINRIGLDNKILSKIFI